MPRPSHPVLGLHLLGQAGISTPWCLRFCLQSVTVVVAEHRVLLVLLNRKSLQPPIDAREHAPNTEEYSSAVPAAAGQSADETQQDLLFCVVAS